MHLVFDPRQPHQAEAIEAVVGVLEGRGVGAGRRCTSLAGRSITGNEQPWAYPELEARVREQQCKAGLPPEGLAWVRAEVVSNDGPAEPWLVPGLSVEMETGTGKTYVFLRTAFELARRVGWSKFVIVVPTVAIREGVLATLRSTRDHFAALYPELPMHYFAYERGRWAPVVRFAQSRALEISVITIDAFNRERNAFRQPQDLCGGLSPLQWWQAMRPVVLLDEAHHLETPLRVQALADLMPVFALRYGATHRRRAGLVHRLSAYEAHRRGLVKTIEVVPAPASSLPRSDHPPDLAEHRFAQQIEAMVAAHLERQRRFAPLGIKVLSLVFLERVADYIDDGIVARLFDACFDRLKQTDPQFKDRGAASVRSAYFARRRDQAVDSHGRGSIDRDAYHLLLRDKVRLLSFEEPVCFIFSHSALREGWDNPNIFQICTLARSHSPVRKRQEIGRGIRLCVDQTGQRVTRRDVQILQVFANESYEAYVASLQREHQPYAVAGEPWVPPQRGGSSRVGTPPTHGAPPPRAWMLPEERVQRAILALSRMVAVNPEAAASGPEPPCCWPVDLMGQIVRHVSPEASAGPVTRRMILAVLAQVRPRARLLTEPERVALQVARALSIAGATDVMSVVPLGTTLSADEPDRLDPMAKIELRIRRLEEGDVLVAEFPDEQAAEAWLRERPPFVEVLRMETAVSTEVEARLRAAMRPLDDQERARQEEHQRTLLSQRTTQIRQVVPEEENTDPDRIMHLQWERTRGLTLLEPQDDRTIPATVYDAVQAWVTERDSWVADRGECVMAATLSVWPAAVPSGRESERIVPGGKFVTGKIRETD